MNTPASLIYTFLLASIPAAHAASYNIVQDFSGQNFFNGWVFADGFDNTTNGAVNWLNQSASTAANLTSINSQGQAIIRVDDTTNLPTDGVITDQLKRNSISLSTADFFPIGSVFVFDAAHIPEGCSVWPAFWTRGPNWPNGGEIDILENVNLATANQMALHTLPGCTQPSNVQQSGSTKGADCSSGTDSRVGCQVVETQQNTFGTGFNSAGGGVWAAQFDASGIFIWFWNRSTIPADVSINSKAVDPSTWGEPSAAWPSSMCNASLDNFFTPQQLVLDVTLCGDFAGDPTVYQQTCSQPGITPDANTCYIQNVNGTGSNYADAFFTVNYVKVFGLNDTVFEPSVSGTVTVLNPATEPVTASATGSAGASATSGSSSTSGSNGSTGGARALGVRGEVVGMSVVGATVVAGLVWSLM